MLCADCGYQMSVLLDGSAIKPWARLSCPCTSCSQYGKEFRAEFAEVELAEVRE